MSKAKTSVKKYGFGGKISGTSMIKDVAKAVAPAAKSVAPAAPAAKSTASKIVPTVTTTSKPASTPAPAKAPIKLPSKGIFGMKFIKSGGKVKKSNSCW